MARPEVLDNRAVETRHSAALAYLIGDVADEHPLAVATGYVDLRGLHELAKVHDGRPLRLMLGAEPVPGLGAGFPPMDRFQLQLEALGEERNLYRYPPSRAADRLRAVEEWLDQPQVEVRRFTSKFLHGKAYLFGDTDDARVALVTSANLTGAGLMNNLELGIANYQPNVARQALAWFDSLWDEAKPFKDELRELLFPDPGRIDPATVYLRALLELRPPQPDDPDRASRPRGVELASFQRDGYERARAIARRHGGVIYADGVGTGKTEIGLAFVEERTAEDGAYALVVTPAQLAKRWRERIDQEKLSAQVVSFQELATDEQLVPDARQPRRHLSVKKDSYRLVIVDEAHALRNQDTTWYRAMERLLGGKKKEVVLLTATPINNGLWDLYNLVMLFARHDRAFSSIGLDSVRELFIEAGANERDPESLSPDVLFPLADAVSVRRDRTFIERNYEQATFPDGTPVRFPKPTLQTHRYDLDAAHPGVFEAIAEGIDGLTMARYRPSAYELEAGEEANVEAQLAGLLKSGLLKRFESCWQACLLTVERMIEAHDTFLAAWGEGKVLSGEGLRKAASEDVDEAGLAGWVEERLEDDHARPVEEFDPAFRDAVESDRARLAAIQGELEELGRGDDPKLMLLVRLLEDSPARKIAVFSTFGATVDYLDRALPERIGGRERVVVIGGETTPDERTRSLARFAPETVVEPGYEPPEGEVDLLISTDVLSEGQNLQQAQAVISYDMPWNPQRVVQRNGRVIRLRSPHEEVFLTTMLPVPGELERLLGLEARIQAKIKAASGIYGMESEVIEGVEAELHSFAERLAAGDPGLAQEAEEEAGAFVGEELRRLVDRAIREGEAARVERLPWGIGACFRQTAERRSRGAPGVFFATRTPPMPGAEMGHRYWRYVELDSGEMIDRDLEILRRIDPAGGEPTEPEGVDIEAAWRAASTAIVDQHNRRVDVRASQERIGPRQRWALDLLRDPTVSLPIGGKQLDDAEAALSVERSSSVRRALRQVQDRLEDGEISRDTAAAEVIGVIDTFGLRPVEPPPHPRPIEAEDLGVVCWMVVLPPSE